MALQKMSDTTTTSAPSPPTIAFKSFKKTLPASLISILGRPGHGKTVTMLTLSEKFDINGKDQVLDDIFVITNEKGALDCVRHCVSEFTYWVDLTEYTDQGQTVYEKMELEAFKMARSLAKEGKIKGVVYDSASTRDKILAAFLSKSFEGWHLINQLLIKHREFVFEQLLPMSVPVSCSFHTRPVGEKTTATEKGSAGLDNADFEIIDLVGRQAASFYRTQGMVIPIFRTPGPKGNDKYMLYPKGINGIEAKLRLKNLDVDVLEPNLRKLLALAVNQ